METNTAGAVAEVAKTTWGLAWIYKWFSNPEQTKKQADADVYEIERKIETAEKYPGWNITFKGGKLNLSECTYEELVNRAKNRMLAEAIKKESNREKVLMLATNEVQQSEKISEKPVDEDWLTRFFHIVGNVSSEEMQVVWSKILAGEIIQPGRFSLRTLETIRNVSKDEAEIFQKVIPIVMNSSNNLFITNDRDILEKNGISYEMILRLGECGLISSNSLLSLNLKVTKHDCALISNNDNLIKISVKDNITYNFSIGVYTLTKAGEELYSILNKTYDKEYVFDLAEKIHTDNKDKVVVSIHVTMTPLSDGRILYINPPLRSFP